MFVPFLSVFVQLIYSLQQNSYNIGHNVLQICFYFKDKNKCPQNIKNYYGPKDYYSNIFIISNKSFEIYIAEPIKLNQPLLFLSPSSYFLNGQQIIGDIELGSQTRLYIQNATSTNIKISWVISSKQISKIYTESKAKSISIKEIDQVNATSSYNLFFYSGNETKIFFSKIKKNNDKIFNISVFNRNLLNYVNFTLYSETGIIKDTGQLGDNVYYELIEYEHLYAKSYQIFVKGKGDMYNFKKSPFAIYKLYLPFQVHIEDGVTKIGDYTFSHLFTLSEITISNTVTYIGKNAFCDTGINAMNFPESVAYIDDSAFELCIKLEYVNTPKKLTYIGASSFFYCWSLKSIIFNEELTIIGDLAFHECKVLTSVSFLNCHKLKTIKLGAFYFCVNLISVKIPDTADTIQPSVFRKCSSLKEVKLPKQLTIINNTMFAYCCTLKSIELPETLTEIRTYSFIYCCSIESIHIPKKVEKIENFAFLYCYKIKYFSIDYKNEHFTIFDGILTPIEKNEIINYPPNKDLISYEIPNNIKNLRGYSFCYCINLKHITIPNSIETIPAAVFQHCQKLESVTILGNCKIGQQCFNYCYDLVSIVYLGTNDAYLAEIMSLNYNSISVYVPNNYISDSFCNYSVSKTNDILCRAIHHKCTKCNDNLCTECENGWKIENNKCILDCESISHHCIECSTTGICLSCEQGYILENEQCIKTNICDEIIENCGVCHKTPDYFHCDYCFDGYNLSSDGLQCIKITNISLPKNNIIIDAKDYINPFSINNVMYNLSLYFMFIHLLNYNSLDDLTVSIEARKNYYYIYVASTNTRLDVVLPPIINKQIKQIVINNNYGKTTDLYISCPKGSVFSVSNETIPNLRGSGTIEIVNPYKINKILLDEESSKPLTLKTTNKHELYINEIQVQYKQKLISELSFCETIIINPYSELTLEKMKVNIVKIGFSSSINIRKEQTNVSHFYIFPAFDNFNKIPIKFYQPFPKLDESDIYFDEEQTIMLDELRNEYIAAKFIGENESINRNACSSMKINANNTIYRSKCIKDEYGLNYNFVVTMYFDVKNKNKIISGEIASYVICGAVCITILMLSIYYITLNIKYKCTKIDENSIDENQIN